MSQRSGSQMAQHEEEYYEDDENYDLEYQLGGLSLQELQQREMAHRRAGGELPVGGMPAGNKNYTFNGDRMNNIGRENQVLLQKLQRIAVKGSGATGGVAQHRPLPSSQAVNRARKEKEIARQNMQIASRLMNAKSATFDKKQMTKDRANQEKYLKNASQYPVQQTSAPKLKVRPAAPGRPPWFKELPSIKQARPAGRPEWQD